MAAVPGRCQAKYVQAVGFLSLIEGWRAPRGRPDPSSLSHIERRYGVFVLDTRGAVAACARFKDTIRGRIDVDRFSCLLYLA